MILTNLYFNLNIDLIEDRTEAIAYRYKFNNRTNHICNYIEREFLKKAKIETSTFKAIGIELRAGFDDKYINIKPFISPNKSLVIIHEFNRKEYDNLKSTNEYREYTLSYILRSLNALDNFEENSLTELINFCKQLEINSFENYWIHKKKICPKRKLRIELVCELTIDIFNLFIDIYQNDNKVKRELILSTEPDPWAYQSSFKDFKIEENDIKVIDKKGNIIKEVSLL